MVRGARPVTGGAGLIMRLFIFGAGYSGLAVARMNAERARAIAGTTRRMDQGDALRRAGVEPCPFSPSGVHSTTIERLRVATHLLVTVAPTNGSDPVLDGYAAVITGQMPALRWIGYLSTVGVYGDHGGAWVDEQSLCCPLSARSKSRLECERRWQRAGEAAGVPTAILRLSGIYGPGRNALVGLDRGTSRSIVRPGQVFNRIHVEDLAGAWCHLAEHRAEGLFNVTDDLPASSKDVNAYAAQLMKIPPPPDIPFELADMTPMARSFHGECKRVCNGKLKRSGYALRYPDYRCALERMWEDGSWRAGPDTAGHPASSEPIA